MATFSAHVTEEEIDKIKEDSTSIKTKQATKYGVKIFQDKIFYLALFLILTNWFNGQNEFNTAFESMNIEDMNKCLSKFCLGKKARRTFLQAFSPFCKYEEHYVKAPQEVFNT